MRPRRYLGAFLVTAGITLAVDLATKAVVTAVFALHEDHAVVGDWVRLTYVRNSGAAFGMFAGGRWPLVAAAVAAVTAVLFLMLRRPVRLAAAVPLGLVAGGAVGNLTDRLRLGEVVDFINVGVGPHRWPVFNCADTAVTVGVILLALALVRGERLSWASEQEDSGASLASPGDGG